MAEVTVITFLTDIQISEAEIPYWRGAVIRMTGSSGEENIFFHDHNGSGYRYSYPLIQYKAIDGRAAVVSVGKGADDIGVIFRGMKDGVRIGRRAVKMSVSDMKHSVTNVSVDSQEHIYTMSRWLPLNQSNYREYSSVEGLVEKCRMLERLLVGNILSFAKGMGIFFEEEVNVEILDVRNQRLYNYKDVKMLGVDVRFRTNVLLPQHIGLGKGVSLGFGTIMGIE